MLTLFPHRELESGELLRTLIGYTTNEVGMPTSLIPLKIPSKICPWDRNLGIQSFVRGLLFFMWLS